jgi:quercetin dioxygenase-like cupin family protein
MKPKSALEQIALIAMKNLLFSPLSVGTIRMAWAEATGCVPLTFGGRTMKTMWAGAALALILGLVSLPKDVGAQQFSVKPLAETKLKQLPAGPLYWRVETLPSLEQAKAAESPTALAVEVAGKVWLLSLGAPGGATAGATRIAEIGPVPPLEAPEYLLRINLGSGPPGAKTPMHTHPGSESFYVVSGRLSQKTPQGESHVDAGGTLNGKGADIPMVVSSTGTTNLQALVMFVVDATRPFSSHATIK